jgi:hypothetical protein
VGKVLNLLRKLILFEIATVVTEGLDLLGG